MWRAALVVCQLGALAQSLWAQEDDVPAAAVTPQDCNLDCIRQGGAGCEYCRITRSDIKQALGFNSIQAFGSCIPWPCFELLGEEDPQICRHYVQAPNDVKVESVHEPKPSSDTIVVSWKPSYYGIAFLRGFQVSLQALGGSTIACQLFLFHRNLSLPATHAQRVYKSDPFPGLSLGTQYAVTVMALPVPEEWERFYHSQTFSTRSCAEKNGLERCKKDWYPEHVEVQQEGAAINVTFNLAPPNLGIRSYFSLCYANGMKKYTDITPIAANEVDAVRKSFNVRVLRIQKDNIRQHQEIASQEEMVSLPRSRLTPPRLLICYSSFDGPAHVKAVMQLGAFIQQHMATQVCLDLWDSLGVAEEGSMGWHCRQIRESDFVLVICSRGLNHRHEPPEPEGDDEGEEADKGLNFGPHAFSSHAAARLVGEEVGRAKARGRDLSKYMAAIFEYSEETDIPTELRLASHYALTSDLPLLFSHLHGVALHRPGGYLKINNISEEGYAKLPAGAALQWAIYEAGMAMRAKRPQTV
ncbi:hypothetical protein F2P81_011962 [Scophthalmus maximus]|uniref:SEFIR domain-containing protein n=1 Tax=Scophthalmus maximus TaxID=52904 RepID=A0A6A4SXS4_SCOMX|nr:hypothetical protein F2P81_011962 [Scophthalmus maximus]